MMHLLERYFEQLFVSIDDYFRTADPSLSRNNLDVRYVLCRPVLDANEGDVQGKRYEAALTAALGRCGVAEDRITFVLEPVAAAYGIAKELLRVPRGGSILALLFGHARDDLSIALGDGRMKSMPSVLHECLAADEYPVDQLAPGREHISVEPHVVLARGEVGVIAVENELRKRLGSRFSVGEQVTLMGASPVRRWTFSLRGAV